MTSHPGLETIVIHILPNIPQSKGNQKDREIFFFKNYAENKAGRLVPDLSLFFKKS